jgi:hypothetical protein
VSLHPLTGRAEMDEEFAEKVGERLREKYPTNKPKD